jgi:hypothetical protein
MPGLYAFRALRDRPCKVLVIVDWHLQLWRSMKHRPDGARWLVVRSMEH